MKVYGIANESHECYGHGDYGTEQRIVRQGAYGSGEFPPVFMNRDSAEKWIMEKNKKTAWGDHAVVEMELIA